MLEGLPALDDPRVLVGMPAGDDAGVYQLDDDTALVQTVDVFSPSVDDPYTFGQIAAANSLSDVYAMGGRPITALSIVGFPVRAMPDEVMREILRGGIDKMAEAGVAGDRRPQHQRQRDQGGLRRHRPDRPEADRHQRRGAAGRPAGAHQAAGHRDPGLRRADRPGACRRAGGGGPDRWRRSTSGPPS